MPAKDDHRLGNGQPRRLCPSALTGAVVLVAPGPSDFLPRLGVELNGPLSLHILGNFVIESTGAGNAFAKLPDIPISRFALRFHGGENALVSTTKNLCPPPPHRAFRRASTDSTGHTSRGQSRPRSRAAAEAREYPRPRQPQGKPVASAPHMAETQDKRASPR